MLQVLALVVLSIVQFSNAQDSIGYTLEFFNVHPLPPTVPGASLSSSTFASNIALLENPALEYSVYVDRASKPTGNAHSYSLYVKGSFSLAAEAKVESCLKLAKVAKDINSMICDMNASGEKSFEMQFSGKSISVTLSGDPYQIIPSISMHPGKEKMLRLLLLSVEDDASKHFWRQLSKDEVSPMVPAGLTTNPFDIRKKFQNWYTKPHAILQQMYYLLSPKRFKFSLSSHRSGDGRRLSDYTKALLLMFALARYNGHWSEEVYPSFRSIFPVVPTGTLEDLIRAIPTEDQTYFETNAATKSPKDLLDSIGSHVTEQEIGISRSVDRLANYRPVTAGFLLEPDAISRQGFFDKSGAVRKEKLSSVVHRARESQRNVFNQLDASMGFGEIGGMEFNLMPRWETKTFYENMNWMITFYQSLESASPGVFGNEFYCIGDQSLNTAKQIDYSARPLPPLPSDARDNQQSISRSSSSLTSPIEPPPFNADFERRPLPSIPRFRSSLSSHSSSGSSDDAFRIDPLYHLHESLANRPLPDIPYSARSQSDDGNTDSDEFGGKESFDPDAIQTDDMQHLPQQQENLPPFDFELIPIDSTPRSSQNSDQKMSRDQENQISPVTNFNPVTSQVDPPIDDAARFVTVSQTSNNGIRENTIAGWISYFMGPPNQTNSGPSNVIPTGGSSDSASSYSRSTVRSLPSRLTSVPSSQDSRYTGIDQRARSTSLPSSLPHSLSDQSSSTYSFELLDPNDVFGGNLVHEK